MLVVVVVVLLVETMEVVVVIVDEVVEVVEVVEAVLPVVDVELLELGVELVVVDDVVITGGPKIKVYEFMFVAWCCPGFAKFPTANPTSTAVPATKLGKGSNGEALLSLKGL